jgi:hypothetical protein
MYREMETPELVERAERNAFEQILARAGWALSPIFIGLAWYFVKTDENMAPVFAFQLQFLILLIVPCLIFVASIKLADLRHRGALYELKRRFGRLSLEAYLPELQASLSKKQIACLFRGVHLSKDGVPCDFRYWAEIRFSLNQRQIASVRRLTREGFGTVVNLPNMTSVHNTSTEDESVAEFITLAKHVRGLGSSKFTSKRKDGFPASAAIVYGDGAPPTIVSCNLDDLTDEESCDDRVRLVRQAALLAGIDVPSGQKSDA